MSGAILAWGIDLGVEDSAKAELFNTSKWTSDGTWDLEYYGRDRVALALIRSLIETESGNEDYSTAKFLSVNLGPDGYPVLASQPTEAELEKLRAIVKQVIPYSGTVELNLEPLLLPTP